jgi:cytochrome c biogenesis protein CcdA
MTTIPFILCLGALIASLNPCTLSVMIMAISSLLGKSKHPRHAAIYTALFALGILVSYAVLGTLLTLLLGALPIGIVGYIAIVVAMVLIFFGVFEIKDYFWYGKGWSFKLSAHAEGVIHNWTKKHHSRWRGFLLGVYTSLRLGHYTIVMIMAYSVLFVLATSHTSLILPSLWAVWYVLPLLLISLLVASGANVHSLITWKEESKHVMRLSIGLLYIALGWILLVFLAGGLHLA